jgi:hypothetical protein
MQYQRVNSSIEPVFFSCVSSPWPKKITFPDFPAIPTAGDRKATCPTIFFSPAIRSFLPGLVFQSLDVPSPQPLHLAPELEEAADLGIIQDSKAIDHRDRPAAHAEDFVGGQLPIGLMADRQNDGIHAFQRFGKVLLDS